MNTATYYKIGTRWYLDYPEYLESGGDIDDLERIGGFYEFLELASRGSSTVRLQVDFEPFEGAELAEFCGSSGGKSGAYYCLYSFEGQPVHIEVWINNIIYLNREDLPERIYFKVIR